MQTVDHPPHRSGSVGSDMSHVGAHHRQTMGGDQTHQFSRAHCVGSDLSLQVGRIAGWPRPAFQLFQQGGFVAATPRTSRKSSRRIPSSAMVRLSGGIEPGIVPPMSAWYPRAARQNSTVAPLSSKTGVTTVTSGRWVPPL